MINTLNLREARRMIGKHLTLALPNNNYPGLVNGEKYKILDVYENERGVGFWIEYNNGEKTKVFSRWFKELNTL